MNRCYWLLNHSILEKQKKELEDKYGIREIITPSDDIEELWKNVPVEEEIPSAFFSEIEGWLGKADKDDVVVIQGEPTAAFKIILHLLERGITVLAGITERRSIEREQDGTTIKTCVYEHVCFRRYSK